MVFRSLGKWLPPVLLAGLVQAASIRGTVVENQTGRALSRALVSLEPVPGTAGKAASVRTNQYGAFDFSGLAGGSYLISASRLGFAPVQYGQKHWKAAALPVTVGPTGSTDITIRMPRFGSIAGTVLDENEVGLPEHEVVAYRATRPPQLTARARTDDRGRYRLSGLEPGKYFVRTAGHQYEDGGYLPTFHGDVQRAGDARAVDVELDRETSDIDVHPAPGRLVTVTGQIAPPAQINITLVSDTGTQTTLSDASGDFQFPATGPGQYELYAQAPADPHVGIQAAYQVFTAYGDRTDLRLTLRPLPQVQFIFRDNQGQPIDYHSVRVIARRKDLAGVGKTQTLELATDRLAFLPGRWDLAIEAPGYFVSSFSAGRPASGDPPHADGWNELVINAGGEARFVLSATPGSVHGQVVGRGHEPVAGAPVYLEAYDPAARRRLNDLQVTRADTQGQYRFTGLAPGNYRLLSSFDFEAPDGPFEGVGTKALRVEESHDVTQNLELF
jgi:hypothetical protein